MRINDILVENKKVTEAPLGMLSKIGHGVKKAFGSGKSSGVLDTGNAANKLKQDYMKMLGSTGQEAEPANLISFLQKAGYPVDRVKSSFGGAPEPKEPAMDPENPAATDAAQAKSAGNRPQGGGKVPGQQSQTPDAIRKRNSRRDAANAKATTGGAGAFNQIGQQLTQPGDAPAKGKAKGVQPTDLDQTNANLQTKIAANKAETDAPAATTPPPQEPEQQTAAPTKSNALGPKGRATLGRLGKQSQDRANPKQDTLDLNSRQRTGKSITEALSDKQIDAAFLTAVQDKAKGGGSAAPAASGSGGNSTADPAAGGGTSPGGSRAPFSRELGAAPSGRSGGISLDGIDTEELKAALTAVVNGQGVDRAGKAEVSKLLKKI